MNDVVICEVTPVWARIYVNGELVRAARKHYEIKALGDEMAKGTLRLEVRDKPLFITDHSWLLRKAGDCYHVAAQLIDDEDARKRVNTQM